jgi:FMN phosphatase YigB (HAD superfamily)
LIVGFDFDRVLFDTEKFKDHLFRSIDGFDETYSEAVDENNVYRPKKHAEILDISMEEFWHAVEYADQCLYEDVDKLEQLPGDLRAVIVSRGAQTFQTEKIKKSGILDYVDEFIVVQERAKDEATGIDFLVDDASIELERTSLPKERLIHFKRSEEDLQDVLSKLKQTKKR